MICYQSANSMRLHTAWPNCQGIVSIFVASILTVGVPLSDLIICCQLWIRSGFRRLLSILIIEYTWLRTPVVLPVEASVISVDFLSVQSFECMINIFRLLCKPFLQYATSSNAGTSFCSSLFSFRGLRISAGGSIALPLCVAKSEKTVVALHRL